MAQAAALLALCCVTDNMHVMVRPALLCLLVVWMRICHASNPTDCPPGKYSPRIRHSSDCLTCDVGTFTNTSGTQDSCFYCEEGTFGELTGQSECQACPLGSYSSSRGSYACLNCLASETTAMTKSKSRQDCKPHEPDSSADASK